MVRKNFNKIELSEKQIFSEGYSAEADVALLLDCDIEDGYVTKSRLSYINPVALS